VTAVGPAAKFLQFSPELHAYYLPIVLVAMAGMAQQSINLVRPDLTWLPPVTRVVSGLASLFILNSVMRIYPYVGIVDPAENWQHYGRFAEALNPIMLISVACTWVGVTVASVISAAQGFPYLRRWLGGDQNGTPGLSGSVAGAPKGRN
jgi:hypothetical protein